MTAFACVLALSEPQAPASESIKNPTALSGVPTTKQALLSPSIVVKGVERHALLAVLVTVPRILCPSCVSRSTPGSFDRSTAGSARIDA